MKVEACGHFNYMLSACVRAYQSVVVWRPGEVALARCVAAEVLARFCAQAVHIEGNMLMTDDVIRIAESADSRPLLAGTQISPHTHLQAVEADRSNNKSP